MDIAYSINLPILAVALGGIVLLVLLIRALRRRRQTEFQLERVIQAISYERLQDILIPDGMDGQIHLDVLLLTARGLLVLDIKKVRGAVFASDRMDDWTVIDGERRFTFANPQGPLYDRVAAARQLVREVPVHGHVVFGPGADFSKGQPRAVALFPNLLERYAKPPKDEGDQMVQAFYPHWHRIRQEAVSAQLSKLVSE